MTWISQWTEERWLKLYGCEVLICGTTVLIQIYFYNLKMYIIISKATIKIKYPDI